MTQFLVRRLIQLVLVLVGITTILFFLLRLSGDPVLLLLGDDATAEQIDATRRELGLDGPLPVQYARFMEGVVRLDFGSSIRYRRPALELVGERLPTTALLAISALLVGTLVAVPIGVVAALRRGTVLSSALMVFALLGQSMPVFWLGILLILLFAVQLRWLPSFGSGGIQHLILPAVTIGALLMAKLMRLSRSGMLEVMSQDYVRTAYAKGLPNRAVIVWHALRNMLIPIVTVVGLELSHLLGGAIITETIFAWPGVGRQMIQAVATRDYPVVQATVFVVALMVVAINFFVDLLYRRLDPRIGYD